MYVFNEKMMKIVQAIEKMNMRFWVRKHGNSTYNMEVMQNLRTRTVQFLVGRGREYMEREAN
jgi:hypothetical protein